MESRNFGDPEGEQSGRPFGLLDLCEVLDLSTAQLKRLLLPVYEIRDAGIYVRDMTAYELAEFQPDPNVPLRRSHKGDLSSAVLPLPFSESELLEFLDLPTEVPFEIERRLTNDPGPADPRPTIDQSAFQRLDVNCADLAAVLRRLLEAGAGQPLWWRAATSAAPAGSSEAKLGTMSPDVLAAVAAERSRAARAAADARHAPTRNAKELVLNWWANNQSRMNKEQAADAIVAEHLVGETRATIRAWLKGA